ncbi:MAG: DUF998 domain-containing protein [Thermoplasmata archaeon]|nr:DUF998 domain-containing protein [Thermoplasmata archaeon]
MHPPQWSYRPGAACGLLAVASFSALYAVAAAGDPGYAFLENYLSDLGVGPAAWAFNAALMLAGALIFAFAVLGVYPLLGTSLPSRAGSALLAVGGALLVNVGIFTEDYGDTHFAFSIAFFLTLLAALGMFAYAMHRTGALGLAGTAMSGSAFAFGLLLLAAGIGPFTETLAVLAAMAWGAAVSTMMLVRPRRESA